MATTGIKLDDGTGAYVNNCFPVRTIIKYGEPGEGAWLEAHRAEQRRRFKAVICSNPPRTYSRLRHERIVAERLDDDFPEPPEEITPGLDGFFLLKQSCVEDPTDLCSINIAAKNISRAQPDDFQLFDNVAYINAADNKLALEIFDGFPILRELELPLNSLSSINLSHTMFRQLEMLDVSYNNLTGEDLLQIGHLRNLKVLYVSGNGLDSLPESLAGFYITKTGFKKRRFPKLEIFCLDDNKLNNYTAFAPLAGLKELKHLNLEHNEITSVPQLEPRAIRQDPVNETTEEQEAEDVEVDEAKEFDKLMEFTFSDLKVSEPMAGEAPGEGGKEEGIQTAEQGEAEEEEETDESEDELDEDDVPAIPFPQLRFLSLAHNYITEEEDLLPLAAWPNLTQVYIHHNPLTDSRSGEPPMLKKYLTDRLGIELVRKQPQVVKPAKELPPARKSRNVSSNIPPVPKCDVEKLLMLEAAKRDALPSTAESPPLPPITSTTTVAEEKEPEELETVRLDDEVEPDMERKPEPSKEVSEEKDDGEAFFMTQVNYENAELSRHGKPPPEYPGKDRSLYTEAAYHEKKTPHKIIRLTSAQERMFRGYEELLIEDEEEKTIKIPRDVHASVKALQYALRHPVVNNNKLRLDANQKPFLPYQRTDIRDHKRPMTKAEKISRAMDSVRRMDTVIEAPLERALTDRGLHKNYPEAAKLLKDIQRKYAKVQSNSSVDAKAVSNIVKNSLGPRPHTDRVYLVDKDTSMTEIHAQQPPSHL